MLYFTYVHQTFYLCLRATHVVINFYLCLHRQCTCVTQILCLLMLKMFHPYVFKLLVFKMKCTCVTLNITCVFVHLFLLMCFSLVLNVLHFTHVFDTYLREKRKYLTQVEPEHKYTVLYLVMHLHLPW